METSSSNNNSDTFIILLFIIAVFYLGYYISRRTGKKEREKLSKENAKLIADNALLEAEHYKFQLEPHTLLHLVASLKMSASKLTKSLESLSEILEYILYSGNKNYVSIQQELSFVDEYLDLRAQFMGELEPFAKDITQVNTKSKHYSQPCIPHLVTAYFIENAFKHGEISSKDPLRISLKLTDKEFGLTVVNKIKEKPSTGKGGIGLNNMEKRLELLVGQDKFAIQNKKIENEFHSTLLILL